MGCEQISVAFIDDIGIFSEEWKFHLCHLRSVF